MAAWRVVGWCVKGCFRGSRRRRSNELYVRKLLFSSDYKWRTKVSAACEWARVIKVPLGIHNYYRITMGFNECQVEINLNWIIIRDLCGIVAIVEITREQFLILHHHPPTNEQVTTLDMIWETICVFMFWQVIGIGDLNRNSHGNYSGQYSIICSMFQYLTLLVICQ